MELQKVVFEDLILEITRRCNLKCAHCAKGDAQNLDMSKEIMDRILEQTEGIGTLRFTGGEPTLNMEGMRYFLEQVKQRNIGLNKISMVINGTNICEDFIELMKEMYGYIIFNKEYGEFTIEIMISKDRFHSKSAGDEHSPDDVVDNLKKKFFGMELVKIGVHMIGEYPKDFGRAKKLEFTTVTQDIRKRRIEVKSKKEEALCLYRSFYTLQKDEQYIVLCPIEFTAKGNLASMNMIDFPYDIIDKILEYTVMDCSIIDLIKIFNFEALPCYICDQIDKLDVRKKILDMALTHNEQYILKYKKYMDTASEFIRNITPNKKIIQEVSLDEFCNVHTKVFVNTYLLGTEKENTSMDDFIAAVYSELDEYVELRIKADRSEDNTFDHVKSFFVVKFSNIIKDFFVEDVIFFGSIKFDIEVAKNLVRRNIAYAKCFLEIYERASESYTKKLTKVKKVAETIIESGGQLLECDMWWMNYVNTVEDYFERLPVYSEEKIKKEGLKNIDKVIKTQKLIIAMGEVKNRLGEIFDEE